MQLVEQFLLPPGGCTICRSNELPAIDLDITEDDLGAVDLPEDRRGALYVCKHCANEIVQLMNGIPAEPAARLRDENEQLKSEVEALTQVRDALEEAITALRRINPQEVSTGV